MRQLVVMIIALAALVVAGIAQSSAGEMSAPDRLFGGGRFVFDFDLGPGELILPRDIAIQAEGRDGKNGSGTRWYGNPNAAAPVTSTNVSCLRVDGNGAVVGGYNQQRFLIVQFFEDNGPPGPDPPDRVTPVFQPDPADPADQARFMELMGKRFPHVCPSSTAPPAEWGETWATLETGDIAVSGTS